MFKLIIIYAWFVFSKKKKEKKLCVENTHSAVSKKLKRTFMNMHAGFRRGMKATERKKIYSPAYFIIH